MRSTAENTFAGSRYDQPGSKTNEVEKERTPSKEFKVDTYNYYDNGIPIEKEVQTQIIRGYHFDDTYYEDIERSKRLDSALKSNTYKFEDTDVIRANQEQAQFQTAESDPNFIYQVGRNNPSQATAPESTIEKVAPLQARDYGQTPSGMIRFSVDNNFISPEGSYQIVRRRQEEQTGKTKSGQVKDNINIIEPSLQDIPIKEEDQQDYRLFESQALGQQSSNINTKRSQKNTQNNQTSKVKVDSPKKRLAAARSNNRPINSTTSKPTAIAQSIYLENNQKQRLQSPNKSDEKRQKSNSQNQTPREFQSVSQISQSKFRSDSPQDKPRYIKRYGTTTDMHDSRLSNTNKKGRELSVKNEKL